MGADDATKSILKDPVCGMTVREQSPHVFKYKDKPVYFCSAGCKTKFAADPAKYLAVDSSSDITASETKLSPSEAIPPGHYLYLPDAPGGEARPCGRLS